MENLYIVYAKTNDSGYIIAVNSSVFIPDVTGWTEIDRGYGDKYHHAQNHYFPLPIVTDGDAYRYKLMDGKPVECTAEEIAWQEAANAAPEIPEAETSVWDELDAAYQSGYNEGYTEGVNTAYDQ